MDDERITSKAARLSARPEQPVADPLAGSDRELQAMGAEELRRLVHLLRERELELQRQNEALSRARLQAESSREALFELIEHAPVGLLQLDSEAVIQRANATSAALLGVESADLAGKSLCSFLIGSDVAAFHSQLQKAFDGAGASACEVQLRRPGRDSLPVRLECRADGQAANGPASCRTIISDISREKSLRGQLERELEIEREYFEAAEVMLLVIDTKGKVHRINRKGRRILGYSQEEIVGRDWFRLALPKEDRAAVRRLFRRLLKGEVEPVRRHENCIVDKSGRQKLIAWRNAPLRGDSGEIFGVLSVGRDITELRQAEDALVRSKSEYQVILDTCIEGIVTVSEHGLIESFNPAAERIFGYKSQDVIGHSVALLMPEPTGLFRGKKPPRNRSQGGSRVTEIGREVIGRRKGGSLFEMQLGVGEAFYDHQRLFVAIVRDLTEQKRLQEEVEQNRVFAALGEMSASVAHEIKNPLAAIGGVVQVLQDQTDRRDPHHEVLSELVDRVDQLNSTVKRLLQFAKPWTLDRQDFGIREILEQLASAASEREAFERVSIRIEGDREIRAPVDLVLFQDVIWNLFYNAVESMPQGGTIRAAVGKSAEVCTIAITDQGQGIPTESLGKIFRPLYTTKSNGTGLGLALCKKIIDAHRGSVQVSSRVDQGTTIVLELPCDQ